MKVLTGDIFESKMQTLVNPVNCMGIMGKGLALEFKNRFFAMFMDYVERCKLGDVQLGFPYIYRNPCLCPLPCKCPPHVINFPTKNHWTSSSEIEDIETGMQYIVDHYKEWGVTSLAIPALGCGNGQLEWLVVAPLIYKGAAQMDIPIEIYAPSVVL